VYAAGVLFILVSTWCNVVRNPWSKCAMCGIVRCKVLQTDFVARGTQTSKSSNNWPFNASQTGEYTHAADGSVKHAPFDASTELPSMVGSAVSFYVAVFFFGGVLQCGA